MKSVNIVKIKAKVIIITNNSILYLLLLCVFHNQVSQDFSYPFCRIGRFLQFMHYLLDLNQFYAILFFLK